MTSINVYSEIGQLEKVLLHRPGEELLNLTPDLLKELLFDDIPGLEKAQEEHDNFAQIFRNNGVEVLYLKDLMVETLDSSTELREKFLNQYIDEANIKDDNKNCIYNFLNDLDNEKLVSKSMAGISLNEIQEYCEEYHHEGNIPLAVYPMPNLYFTRDPFTNIGDTVTLNKLFSTTRDRETIYGEYIFNYHPIYKDVNLNNSRYQENNIEGGDILVINEELIIIGISQRTNFDAIEKYAKAILADKNNKFKYVLAMYIPDKRTFMHLDTVFTQVSEDTFVIHPEILDTLKMFKLTKDNNKLENSELNGDLKTVLSDLMNKDISLVYCGGNDIIASQREQWSDGANTLAISPGKLIVYKRNVVTNKLLREKGFELFELEADNLGVGRGGPRCMSLPFYRK